MAQYRQVMESSFDPEDPVSTMGYSTQSQQLSPELQSSDISFSILWSPLPPITWLIPFIGHVGISNSQGIASDFQGPYYVGDRGHMAFGLPTRAVRIVLKDVNVDQWDEAIRDANEIYRGRMHNICCDNCHSHVANALNRMPIKPPIGSTWNMVTICFYIFFRGRFLSPLSFVLQFGPFLVVMVIIMLLKL